MRPTELALAVAIALAGVAAPRAGVADEDLVWLRERVRVLEERVEELEAREIESAAAPARRDERDVRIGGSANTGWANGQENSVFDEAGFDVADARFFVDAELARDARLGERPLFRDATLAFEWNLVRLGMQTNGVGDLYVDFRELGGRRLANAQVGRFQLPVGENYERFGRGYAKNPFVTSTVGGPWWWDEGIKLFGETAGGRAGYVASLTDGEGFFNADGSSAPQTTLKLFVRPTEWLRLSVSGLRSGELGGPDEEPQSALWLGEAWAQAFGQDSALPNFQDGVEVPDGPSELLGLTLLGADVVLHAGPFVRLWLGGGGLAIDSEGGSPYDRDLRYWIAELVLDGGLAARALEPFYLALRANGLGTYARDEGYLLDFRTEDTIGYNARSLEAYSVAAGWRLAPGVTLRAEYTRSDFDLVRGVTPEIRAAADRTDFFGAELGVEF
jgi:hypothetical protein